MARTDKHDHVTMCFIPLGRLQNHANLIAVSLIYEEKSHGMAVNKTINRNSTERERRLIKENFSAALRICTEPKKQQKTKQASKKAKQKKPPKTKWFEIAAHPAGGLKVATGQIMKRTLVSEEPFSLILFSLTKLTGKRR